MTGFLWGEDAEAFFEKPSQEKAPSSEKRTASAGKSGEAKPLSVTQLNAWIKRTLDQSIPGFWVAGEIGSLTRSGAGHVYLTLKDETNQISAVIWKSTWEKFRFEIHEGMAVLCAGRLDVYGPRGSYQIVVQRIEPQGIGALQIAFRKLHAKLEAEGLFRPERKRPIPRFPKRIGFVTSPHGAAIHDFLEVLRRRWPQTSVLVIPSKVQGAGAAEQIAAGIAAAARVKPALDILIVGRGGGSIEDLWCFNEEVVVRAVAASPIPTVSAVGHEIDVTLCDLAADVRALTPSEAAERVVPNREEIIEWLQTAQTRLWHLMHQKLREYQARWTGIATRPAIEQPQRLLELPMQKLDELERQITQVVEKRLEQQQHAFDKMATRLETISPLRTLSRGYTFTTDETTGTVIHELQDVREGQIIRTRVVDGILRSQVLSLDPNI
jgi:exodeoxyribonuclease VII large subunit